MADDLSRIFYSECGTGPERDILLHQKCGISAECKNLISQIRKACSDLSEFPERGRIVPELNRIGIFDYRELIVKVYRIIYAIDGKNVYIHCILDGRRDIQTLLQQRMLG